MRSDAWILVVNWNGAALLPACLSALSRSTRPAHVVVVDNGSVDPSREVVARFPGVEWLPLGANTGFAQANDVGLRRALAAGARWIALVNPDVEVAPDWLDRLVEAGEAHPRAGLLAGLLLFRDRPDVVNSTGLEVDGLGRATDRDFDVPLAALRRSDGPMLGASGGAVVLRDEMLRQVGLFDPAYFAYYEDLDLSLRAARLGWDSWYVSSARAVHGYAQSFGASPRKKFLLARNHLRVVATHAPLWKALLLPPALAAGRAVIMPLVELARRRPAMAWAHLAGAAAGLALASEAIVRRARGEVVPRLALPASAGEPASPVSASDAPAASPRPRG
ncbi:MAG TPA: glycosyltransferase family 2 protein [Anaeromyxobacteraceae bacterium]|nr:glycosyltransferase family 2 protein [Anaeromyxobacteraceae bacterium]